MASSVTTIAETVLVGKSFGIKLIEPICRNCDWHLTLPPGVVLTDRKHENQEGTSSITWTFSINKPGTYILDFVYQKRCCGKPILKHSTYKITAH